MGEIDEVGQRVVLTVDLTAYDPGFTEGVEGVIVPDSGKWARNRDGFVSVRVGHSTLDVARSGFRKLPVTKADTLRFLSEVELELVRARAKFPSSNLVLAALTEEVGELAQAMLKVRAGTWPPERIWAEAVQVAAMACRVATEGDPSFAAVGYVEP